VAWLQALFVHLTALLVTQSAAAAVADDAASAWCLLWDTSPFLALLNVVWEGNSFKWRLKRCAERC